MNGKSSNYFTSFDLIALLVKCVNLVGCGIENMVGSVRYFRFDSLLT